MLKIQKEFTEDHQVKIVAEFEAEVMEQYKHKAARKLSRKAKIAGFRPGKAPYSVILSQLGELSVSQEAIDMILEEEYPKVIEEAGIKPSGPGNLVKIDSDPNLVFHFIVPLEPEVELGDYSSIKKAYQPETFDEKKVEDFIYHLRRNSATIVPLESAAEEGNVVFLSLHAESDEKENNTIIENSPQQVLIYTKDEENESEYPFKGFSRKLIGHKADEEVVTTHKFAKDHKDEQFKGKKVTFSAKIQSVKGLELPNLEGDFLKSLGEFENADEFRNVVRDHLIKEEQSSYDEAYYLELVDEIRKSTTIKYPPQVLDEEIDKVLHRVEVDLKRQNIDLETYFKIRQTDREKYIEDEAKPAAIARLERSLVMDAFASKQGIKLNEEKLKVGIDQVISELIREGSLNDMQKDMGSQKFFNAVTIEAANRQMEVEIRKHLKAIANGEPFPIYDDEIKSAEEEISVHSESTSIQEI